MKINFYPKYQVFQDKVVKCTMECSISDCNELIYISKFRGYDIEISALPNRKLIQSFIVTSTAKCNPADTFDLETGKRIAESRASIKALALIDGLIQESKKEIDKTINIIEEAHIKTSGILAREIKHLRVLLND